MSDTVKHGVVVTTEGDGIGTPSSALQGKGQIRDFSEKPTSPWARPIKTYVDHGIPKDEVYSGLDKWRAQSTPKTTFEKMSDFDMKHPDVISGFIWLGVILSFTGFVYVCTLLQGKCP